MKKANSSLILLVDDSLDSQLLLKMVLEAEGHRVECASNGLEALSLLEKLAKLPDLIFLDAQMPLMDGYEFRNFQMSTDRLKLIPTVVMTGDCDPAMNAKMRGPLKVLTKPIDLSKLIECIPDQLTH